MPYVARSSHPRLTNLTPMSKPATPVARLSAPTISRLPIGSPATPSSKQRSSNGRTLIPYHQLPASLLTATRCPLLFPSQTVSDQPVRCSATTAAQPASISPPASSAVDHLSHPSTVPRSATADPRGPDYEFTPAHQYASSIPVHSASLNCSGSPPSCLPKLLLWPRPHHPLHVVSIGAACSACFFC